MNQTDIIYELLCEEYAVSRHIFWFDEETGRFVNDVSYTASLIEKTAECLRDGRDDCWRELAAYAIERSMSYLLMHAIGEYLMDIAELEPLPVIDLSEPKYRNWRGGTWPLFDETERAQIRICTEKPEPDRDIAFKREHRWSITEPRYRDEHPAPETETVAKGQHWLF